ncbi:hypothetical protein L9F63_001209 [Diploptera punctata]|uniref:Uncharacterized protein n=1 Tax=Diploptera punctata TaxID=6984 RepID=A0AAD8A6A7_DIPPU|nr:hypothetical protein L9F63_001209 [Diploptera punctata]
MIIDENAFNDKNFKHVNYFTFAGKLKYLKKYIFNGLTSLQYLDIRIEGTQIEYTEAGILTTVPRIRVLQIQQNITYDTFVNFTADVTFKYVVTLDIRNNNLSRIKSDTLSMFPYLQQIFIDSSKLHYIDPDAFSSLLSTIETINLSNNNLKEIPSGLFDFGHRRESFLINLNNNKLETLPKDIFNTAIEKSRNLIVSLHENNWVCDCKLAWLQDMIVNEIISFPTPKPAEPECISPEYNKFRTIRDADFEMCTNTTKTSTVLVTETSTTTSKTETTSSTSSSTISSNPPTIPPIISDTTTTSMTMTTINSISTPSSTKTTSMSTVTEVPVTTSMTTEETSIITHPESSVSSTTQPPPIEECTCQDDCHINKINIYAKDLLKHATATSIFLTFQNITIKEDDVKKELIVEISQRDYILLWMYDKDNDIQCNFTAFKEDSCESSGLYIAKFKTQPSTSYTVCAASINEDSLSPLNCRAHTTMAEESERAWLLNDEQVIVWSIFATVILICFVFGGALVYILIRRYPRLIKGNKRVIIVRQRPWDVMVMPKEYYYTTKGEDCTRFRRNSETSYYTARTSSTSYVTAIQPTPVQLISWKFNRMWNRLTSDGEKPGPSRTLPSKEPPPLPPYPREPCCRGSCELNYPYDSSNSCYAKVVTEL